MHGALHGLRVLDLTALIPGPLATLLLADLGADVLRVDPADRDDLLRWLPPHDASGQSALWRMLGRNKRSIGLDARSPAGRAVLLRLVDDADVLVEQFRPGVLDRLGLGWSALHARNPRLVLCSISAFGQTGPDRARAGHDLNALARAGVAAGLGRAGEGPLPLNILAADVAGGTWPAVAGVLAALLQRQRTGLGQHVDVAMTDGAFWLGAVAATAALAGAPDAGPAQGLLDGGSFYDYYRTRDGRFLAVAALEPKFWGRLLAVLGRPDLEGAYLATGPEGAALKAELAATIGGRDLADWREAFAAVDCCVEPVLGPREALQDPQLQARAMVWQVEGPDGAPLRQVGCPIRLQGAPDPAAAGRAGPDPGADTRAVLAEAGYDEAAIAALLAEGAVFGAAR